MAIGEGGIIDQPVKKYSHTAVYSMHLKHFIYNHGQVWIRNEPTGYSPHRWPPLSKHLLKVGRKKILLKKFCRTRLREGLLSPVTDWGWEEEERTKQTLMFFVEKGHSWVWIKTPALPRLQPYSFSHYPELVTIVEGGNVKTNEWLWFQAQLSLHHKRLGYTHPL